jgi:hypothetical protein
MSDSADWRKWALFGLLILHIAWIGNHLRLVATDQINPWRLGGYGMYTVPNPAANFEVYSADSPDVPLPINRLKFEAADRLTNPGRTFRCADVSAASLRAFFDENSFLIGTNLVFVFTERLFVHIPPSVEERTQGTVEVKWPDERSFTATSKFCGKEHTETVVLPDATL